MKYILVLGLLCLTLAACGNCEAEGNNDEQKGRCWLFSKVL